MGKLKEWFFKGSLLLLTSASAYESGQTIRHYVRGEYNTPAEYILLFSTIVFMVALLATRDSKSSG